jgi:hypothetical protein
MYAELVHLIDEECKLIMKQNGTSRMMTSKYHTNRFADMNKNPAGRPEACIAIFFLLRAVLPVRPLNACQAVRTLHEYVCYCSGVVCKKKGAKTGESVGM